MSLIAAEHRDRQRPLSRSAELLAHHFLNIDHLRGSACSRATAFAREDRNELTTEQVVLVRDTFTHVIAVREQAAALFYERLLAIELQA